MEQKPAAVFQPATPSAECSVAPARRRPDARIPPPDSSGDPPEQDVFRAGRNSPPAVGAAPPRGHARARERFRGLRVLHRPRKVSRSGPMPEPTVGSGTLPHRPDERRSEEHTSELQSLMRNSYAV